MTLREESKDGELARAGFAGRTPSMRPNWNEMRVKHGFAVIGSGTTPPSNREEYYGGTIPWVNTSELRENTVLSTGKTVTSLAIERYSALKTYPAGAVLVAMYGATIGRVGMLGIDATVNQAVCVLAQPTRFVERFVFYCLQSSRESLIAIATGGGQPNLNAEKIREHRIPCPEVGIQKLVADFLDRETMLIDALVAEKEQMLALLQEKRIALVSRAVTRGVDSSIALRPSGQEWLGDIPTHWTVTKFSWSIFIGEGQVDPEDERYSQMTLVAPNHIEPGTGIVLLAETASEQGAISGKYYCRKGEVLYSKIRPALRKAALAQEDCLCSADMYALRPNSTLNPKFLLYFLLSEEFSNWAELESERVAMPKVNRESLSAIRVPVPPLPEQSAIVSSIELRASKIDLQREAVQSTIELLKERRSALITAAVTGQVPIEEMRL